LIRSVAVLVSAMLLSRPGMPKDEANRYAKVLNEVAKVRAFDPLIAVAIIHFETQWRPRLVSADGEDYGLGQVRARFLGACQHDEDPVHAPSEACLQAKNELLDGPTNLRRMGSVIAANMDFCKSHTGSTKTERWLSGYQGYWDAEHGKYCTPGEKTFQVLGYYNDLIAKFAPPPKKKPAKVNGKGKTEPASGKGEAKKAENSEAPKASAKRPAKKRASRDSVKNRATRKR